MEHPKNLVPLLISATVEASNFKFGTQLGNLGLRSRLPKKTLRLNLVWVWARR